MRSNEKKRAIVAVRWVVNRSKVWKDTVAFAVWVGNS